jgi:hypothetical protein
MAQDLRTSRELMLSPAGTRTVNEANVEHLTHEKHPASKQVLSEYPDSPSIQEVRLQTFEATGPVGSRDGQEENEQEIARKNAGLFSRLWGTRLIRKPPLESSIWH